MKISSFLMNQKIVVAPVIVSDITLTPVVTAGITRRPPTSRNHYLSPNPEQPYMGEIIDDPRLRDKNRVFTGRHDAGRKLGAFIKTLPGIRDPLVLAIPAGGVPVGKEVAVALGAPLSLAIVRKIRIPGSTEAGFGAVTWDGQVLINERLRASLGLSQPEVDLAIAETRNNVSERITRFTGGKGVPSPEGKTAILVDDGLASGFTMLAAVQSLRTHNPAIIIVAVPTASASSAELVARSADKLVCLNIRTTWRFAVADAYEQWYDLDDQEVLEELAGIQ
jgi:putative phosphoribosyl transferase